MGPLTPGASQSTTKAEREERLFPCKKKHYETEQRQPSHSPLHHRKVNLRSMRDMVSQQLAKKSIDLEHLDARDDLGQTPLLLAVKRGDVTYAKLLLHYRSNINQRDNEGNNLLHTAIKSGSEEIVKLLLRCGIKVDPKKADDRKLLIEASKAGAWQEILEHPSIKALANTPFFKRSHTEQRFMNDLLKEHITKSVSQLGKFFYDSPSDTDNEDETPPSDIESDENEGVTTEVLTPLSIAAQRNDINTVKRLIANGEDVNKLDQTKRNPLYYAVEAGKYEMVEYLLTRAKAKIDQTGWPTELHYAIYLASEKERVARQSDKELSIDSDEFKIIKLLADAYKRHMKGANQKNYKQEDKDIYVSNNSPVTIQFLIDQFGKATTCDDYSLRLCLRCLAEGPARKLQKLALLEEFKAAGCEIKNLKHKTLEEMLVSVSEAHHLEEHQLERLLEITLRIPPDTLEAMTYSHDELIDDLEYIVKDYDKPNEHKKKYKDLLNMLQRKKNSSELTVIEACNNEPTDEGGRTTKYFILYQQELLGMLSETTSEYWIASEKRMTEEETTNEITLFPKFYTLQEAIKMQNDTTGIRQEAQLLWP